MALLLAPAVLAQAQSDFTVRGPATPAQWKKTDVSIQPATTSSPVKLDIIVTYPTVGGPFPVIFFFNGFQAKASWYSAIVAHIVSWNYTVVQYTVPGLSIVPDKIELGYLQPLTSWVVAQAAAAGSPLGGKMDLTKKAVMGHSRGGRLASLHLAARSDISACVLVDPVDGSSSSWTPSTDYPSGTAALNGTGRTVGIIAAGRTGSCNPAGQNYPKWWGVVSPGSWLMVVRDAGHMQFARTGNPFMDWTLDTLCGRGSSISAQTVMRYTGALATAWLSQTFRAAQSATAVANFRMWAAGLTTGNVASWEIKPAPAQ
ncbi:hypothetical protein HYH03_010256 [Edaphochlamys debaryana]|uniref:Chlorophyllase n=1 Tax=Edaphochlamys debaryana TaxID=47281 RepID=A0A836BW86_9CHLO|nr:hypothetical protein HYH03_010256 [Edaphochlamys debaryana]|eukprot:KAG2491471.1 hypothetical protein HYH03_010256 [Edaphochlamys debaryana]